MSRPGGPLPTTRRPEYLESLGRVPFSEQHTLKADSLFVFIVIETVVGPSGAPFFIFTVLACGTPLGKMAAVRLKFVFPNLGKLIFHNVAED